MGKKTKKKIKTEKIVTPKKVNLKGVPVGGVMNSKKPKIEKIKVTDISQPSNAELSLRLAVVETRLSALIEALKSSKGLKGI